MLISVLGFLRYDRKIIFHKEYREIENTEGRKIDGGDLFMVDNSDKEWKVAYYERNRRSNGVHSTLRLCSVQAKLMI